MKKQIFCVMCLSAMLWASMASADELNPQNIVRARIGVELRVGEESHLARKYERVLPGDMFRMYVIPEPEPAYIYVVYSDQKTAERLNELKNTRIPKDDTLIMPSLEQLYQFDDSSQSVFITVICSATELPEIDALLNGSDPSHAKWVELEEQFIKRSKIDLREVVLPSWELGAAVRGTGDEEFLEQLKISSGKSLVVKTFEFRVGR